MSHEINASILSHESELFTRANQLCERLAFLFFPHCSSLMAHSFWVYSFTSKPMVLRTSSRMYAFASTESLKATARPGMGSRIGRSRPRI
jgi:hypothetical protein